MGTGTEIETQARLTVHHWVPGVSVTVKEAMVLPRAQKCANRIPGGILMISAKDIQDQSYTPLTVRITYNTKDGERKRSQVFNLSLFP